MIQALSLLDRLNAGIGPDLFSAPTAAPGAGAAAATSFAQAVEAAASKTVATLNAAESSAATALQNGEVSAREVVDAVMSAEQALQTAIAIRDKVVTAYLEVSRMAI